MPKNFSGIAYWTVSTTNKTWAASACEILRPCEGVSGISLSLDFQGESDLLGVTIDEKVHTIRIDPKRGQGRGVVEDHPTSPLFIVCLLALRRHLGDITMVSETQATIPQIPRATDPLFKPHWVRVEELSESLGLVPNLQASAAMRRLIF